MSSIKKIILLDVDGTLLNNYQNNIIINPIKDIPDVLLERNDIYLFTKMTIETIDTLIENENFVLIERNKDLKYRTNLIKLLTLNDLENFKGVITPYEWNEQKTGDYFNKYYIKYEKNYIDRQEINNNSQIYNILKDSEISNKHINQFKSLMFLNLYIKTETENAEYVYYDDEIQQILSVEIIIILLSVIKKKAILRKYIFVQNLNTKIEIKQQIAANGIPDTCILEIIDNIKKTKGDEKFIKIYFDEIFKYLFENRETINEYFKARINFIQFYEGLIKFINDTKKYDIKIKYIVDTSGNDKIINTKPEKITETIIESKKNLYTIKRERETKINAIQSIKPQIVINKTLPIKPVVHSKPPPPPKLTWQCNICKFSYNNMDAKICSNCGYSKENNIHETCIKRIFSAPHIGGKSKSNYKNKRNNKLISKKKHKKQYKSNKHTYKTNKKKIINKSYRKL